MISLYLWFRMGMWNEFQKLYKLVMRMQIIKKQWMIQAGCKKCSRWTIYPIFNVPFLRKKYHKKDQKIPFFVNHHMVDGHDREHGHLYSCRWTFDWIKLCQLCDIFLRSVLTRVFFSFSEQYVLQHKP